MAAFVGYGWKLDVQAGLTSRVPARLLIVWDRVRMAQATDQRQESALPKSSIPAQSPKVSENSTREHGPPSCSEGIFVKAGRENIF